jgi:DNA gyrase/topoisomerase IV subunit B
LQRGNNDRHSAFQRLRELSFLNRGILITLEDERDNTREALPLIQQDMRLDPYYGGDHTFPHGEKMIEAKLAILKQEISDYLPSLRKKLLEDSP